MKESLLPCWIIVVCLGVFGGCSRENRPRDLPALTPVTITFTQDEKPLENALVILYPENPDLTRWTVSSHTDSVGKAILVTHGQFRGAPSGKFKVCVSKSEDAGSAATSDANAGLVLAGENRNSGRPRLVHHVNPTFGDPKKTPLEIEVPTRGRGEFALDVSKP